MHAYGVQSIVTGEVEDVHVVRLRFYADKDLETTVGSREVFKHAFTQGEFEMAGMVGILEAEEGHRVLTSKRTELDSTRERVRGNLKRLFGTARRKLSSRSCGS